MNSYNSEDSLKEYLTSKNLLLYSPPKEIDAISTDFFGKNKKDKEIKKEEEHTALRETLNSMFLPKKWEEEGRKFIQYVSPKPASRDNARDLFKALDQKIKERKAKEKGICPVREQLYSECFDEIIRQVTIDSPERGLLLLRVRDEIKMTIASYQTLYESSVLYGIRKQLQAEDHKNELKNELCLKEKKNIELTNKKQQLENKLLALKKHIEERNEIESARRQEEKDFLKKQKENLENFLRSINQNTLASKS